jgi:hypothetical protein
MLNAENFPRGLAAGGARVYDSALYQHWNAGQCAYSLNLKSGGSANYPGDENPAFNDSGPIAKHLTTATGSVLRLRKPAGYESIRQLRLLVWRAKRHRSRQAHNYTNPKFPRSHVSGSPSRLTMCHPERGRGTLVFTAGKGNVGKRKVFRFREGPRKRVPPLRSR